MKQSNVCQVLCDAKAHKYANITNGFPRSPVSKQPWQNQKIGLWTLPQLSVATALQKEVHTSPDGRFWVVRGEQAAAGAGAGAGAGPRWLLAQ
jgi:hypothetical protein